MLLTRHLQHIEQSVDTDVPSQLGLRLGHRTEQCRQVVNGVDVIAVDGFGYLRRIGDVDHHRRPALGQSPLGLGAGDIACHDVAGVYFSQFHGQFRAYLASGTDNQHIFH